MKAFFAIIFISIFSIFFAQIASAQVTPVSNCDVLQNAPEQKYGGTNKPIIVQSIEEVLKNLGYTIFNIDSNYDLSTVFSVATFQDRFGLPVSGIANESTNNLLYKYCRVFSYINDLESVTQNTESKDVITLAPTNISDSRANLKGKLSIILDNPTYTFEYAKDRRELVGGSSHVTQVVTTSSFGSNFYKKVTNLDPNQTYYYRACVNSSSTTKACGEIVSFATEEIETIVDSYTSKSDLNIDTLRATITKDGHATLYGLIRNDGEGNVDGWFELDINQSDLVKGKGTLVSGDNNLDTDDTYEGNTSSLATKRQYYFRACGEDLRGNVACGSPKSFTPSFTDKTATAIDTLKPRIYEDKVIFRGYVQKEGEGNVDSWFEYSTNLNNIEKGSSTIKFSDTSLDSDTYFEYESSTLSPDTLYFVRACGEDKRGNTSCGNIENFYTQKSNNNNETESKDVRGSLIVDTKDPSHIEDNKATLNGIIQDEGPGNVTAWFEYDTNSNNITRGLGNIENKGDGFDSGDIVRAEIRNLAPSQIYFFRLCGEDKDRNTRCGNIKNFYTKAGDHKETETKNESGLKLLAINPEDILDETATPIGKIQNEGSGSVDVWFEYSISKNAIYNDSGKVIDSENNISTNDTFQEDIRGLSEDTLYYFRACGEDKEGNKNCSNPITFRTLVNQDKIKLDTKNTSSIGLNYAKVAGEIIEDDGENITIWFQYSTNYQDHFNGSAKKLYLSGSFDKGDKISTFLTGLNPNTRYYFRACGQTEESKDIDCGSVKDFITKSQETTYRSSTLPAEVLSNGSVRLKASITKSLPSQKLRTWFEISRYKQLVDLGFGQKITTTPLETTESSFVKTMTNLSGSYYYRSCISPPTQTSSSKHCGSTVQFFAR